MSAINNPGVFTVITWQLIQSEIPSEMQWATSRAPCGIRPGSDRSRIATHKRPAQQSALALQAPPASQTPTLAEAGTEGRWESRTPVNEN
jgi:hypothetical protein